METLGGILKYTEALAFHLTLGTATIRAFVATSTVCACVIMVT